MKEFTRNLLLLVLLGSVSAFNGIGQPPDASHPCWRYIFPRDAFCAEVQSPVGSAAEGEARGPVTVDVIGRGTIYGDDLGKARSNAIADALQGAAEKAVGLVLPTASVVEDFQLLSDQVYNQTEAFISDYKVLTESKSGKYYRVLVRATVSLRAIQDRLQSTGVLMTDKELPTLLFFLSEQYVGQSSPTYWWGQAAPGSDLSVVEEALSEYMGNKGFPIAKHPEISPDDHLSPEYRRPEISKEAAMDIGKQIGAHVVIIGAGVARHRGNVSDMNTRSIQARVSARAVRTDNGRVVASSEETRGVVSGDDGKEALTLSASAVAQDLTRQITSKWREDPQQAISVELVVKGIREYADFIRFRKHLKTDIRGVKNVHLRSITTNEAKMDVEFTGNAKTLADDLMLQPFEALSVSIIEVSEEGVLLELIPMDMHEG
jgi:hypothetical protein